MGLAFALELDGVNPFHNIGVIYSMTPIMLTILNLPRHMRNAFGNILLAGIIKGNKNRSEANTDCYVEILVDELLFLNGFGKVYSAYDKAPVEVKLKLLIYVLDYPGLSKLFHQQGSGSMSGCHWCSIRGIHCKHLQKVIYLGNRSYLERDNPLRQDSVHFYPHCTDVSSKPKARSSKIEKDYREAFDNAINKTQASCIASATGCKGNYPLLSIPDHDRLQECCPDACHTVKDVVQNIVHLLTGKNINKDKIMIAEQEYARLGALNVSVSSEAVQESGSSDAVQESGSSKAVQESGSSEAVQQSSASVRGSKNLKRKWHSTCKRASKQHTKSQASAANDLSVSDIPYFLTSEDIKKADERASSLVVPLGFGLKPTAFFTKSGSLKSHEWKQLAAHGILKYCLRGMLGEQQRLTLFRLLDSISDLCNESQCLDDLDELEERLNESLALLERDFPLTLQNITTHILHHVVDGIRNFGPVYGTWMFVFERFNSWICKRALNMRHPESCVIETYILFDWCQFMITSGKVDVSVLCKIPEDSDNGDENITLVDDPKKSNKCIKLKQRQLDSVHKQCKVACRDSSCTIEKFSHGASIEHPTVKRIVTYSCTDGQSVLAKTVSSYVCFENDRGLQGQKLSSGKYIVFGQIKFFVVHKSKTNDTLALVGLYGNANFDQESGLWFVKPEDLEYVRFSYIHLSLLSPPLVTAKKDGCLWFCNCKKIK